MAWRWRHWGAMLGLIAVTVTAYWPGLSGGYLFDDTPNFVDNPDVHVTSLDWPDWRRAALASPSAELRRPLAMLSLAANYYFTQIDPYPMKLVNLAIHLLNGLLLWRVLLRLLTLWRERQPHAPAESTIRLAALSIAGAWLLAPINLSAVLYIVQRMESMAQTFVLAGLWIYLAGRQRMLSGANSRGALWCAFGLMFGSGLGVLCKESAALLPLFAFLLELSLLRFEAPTPAGRRALWAVYGLLLFLPAVIGLVWVLPRTLSVDAYASRPFTLEQRLLTEMRVLIDYVVWTLFPHPAALSFYHDDMVLSRGWLSPPATLGCAALIAAAAAAAVLLRRRLPLLALGIGWYFAAHLLTATIIPLELVFEHRNYFASIGLLLAASALILAIPARYKVLRTMVPLLALGVFAAVTWMRATEWRYPVDFAYAEAIRHPLSARANSELGQTLAAASRYRSGSRLVDPAMEAFERAARLPDSSASPLAGLIILSSHTHRSIRPEWWTQLKDKLAVQPPSQESITALESLSDCQRKRECPPETDQLLAAYMAGLTHSPPAGRLLASYGAFAANQLGDYALAEQMLSDALISFPDIPGIRFNLVKVLVLENKFGRARQVLDEMRREDMGQADAARAAALDQMIQAGLSDISHSSRSN